MYRQGDVFIERVAIIPKGLETTTDRLLVRGEGRNHGHFIIGSKVEIFAVEATGDNTSGVLTHYLDIGESAVLEHQLIDRQEWSKEHAAIEIPPGQYRVIRQREFNPYARAIRVVRD